MSKTISRIKVVMEAVNYCICWNHPYTDMELTYDEFRDLLTEHYSYCHSAPPLVRGSAYVHVWGVKIRAEEFPQRSVMRTKYLQLINPAPWIDRLAEDMEQYS